MDETRKPWIFTHSCEYSPEGNLSLGQILGVPKNPDHILQPLGPLPLTDSGPKPKYDALKVETTSRTNVNMQTKEELAAHFNAWANLGHIPVRLNAGLNHEHQHDLTWHFDKLESKIMAPTNDYVKLAMRHGDVPSSLSFWNYKHRVYMVTGVRIVSGARMERIDKSSTGAKAAAGAPTPDQSVSMGAEAEYTDKASTSEDFENSTDFVFAYRLNEIRYRGKITHKPYTDGQTSSADKTTGKAVGEVEINDFEVLRVVEDPFAGDAKNFDVMEVPGFGDLVCLVGKGDQPEGSKLGTL